MAADSCCSDDDGHYLVNKIRVYGDVARAACGEWAACNKMFDAIQAGAEVDSDLDAEMLELRADGIYVYESGMSTPTRLKNEYFAIGTGSSYAIAAMRLGCSPVEAVSIAAEFDVGTRPPIDVFNLPEQKKRKTTSK
jgi:ATP-dependent protease HslVU (ClpYQ) peptidase subunit